MTASTGFGFPNTDCEAGLNARIHFPACWDGKVRFHTSRSRCGIFIALQRVESADQSHVAFLSRLDNGACPKTHPVGLMKLFYEVRQRTIAESFQRSLISDHLGRPRLCRALEAV